MTKRLSFSAVIIVVAMFLSSYPVLAQYGYGKDEGKYIVEVVGWWAIPTGMGFDVATVDPNYDLSGQFPGAGGEIIGMEMDSTFSGKYTLGWNFKKDFGSLTLSYWDYDKDSSVARSGAFRSYLIGEILPHTFYAGQGIYPFNDIDGDGVTDTWERGRADAVEGIANIQATIYDLEFSKIIPQQQRFSGLWRIGLRYFEYEHFLQATYLGDPFDYGVAYEVLDVASETMKADGVGPKVGFFGTYSFTPNVALYGGMDISFIPGKIDTQYLSINDLEDDLGGQEIASFGPFPFRLNKDGEDESFFIYDFDAGFKVAIAEKLNLTLGYRLTKMENVIYRLRFTNDSDIFEFYDDPERATSTHEDVSFSGLYFGIGYEF
jgi:hypothetical protein